MNLIRSVPICALAMAAVWLSTVPTLAQSVLETPEIKAFLQHAEKNDCAYLNDVTDKNITQSSPLGIAAQLYALDALTNESELPPSRRVCRYHETAGPHCASPSVGTKPRPNVWSNPLTKSWSR
jgi:hypothetical protein